MKTDGCVLCLGVVGLVLTCLSVSVTAQFDDRQQRIDALNTWITANGGDMSKLDVFPSPWGGYGTRAKTDLSSGDIFVQIPTSVVLNEGVARKHPILGPLIDEQYARNVSAGEHGWSEYVSLVVFVMFEGMYVQDSFYTPYLRLLPVSFPGHRVSMSHAERSIAAKLAALYSDFQEEYPNPFTVDFVLNKVIIPHPELFGVDSEAQRVQWKAELKWAFAIVQSRSYNARFEGDYTTLIPVLDLLNHWNNGSLSYHAVADTDATNIVAYGKKATMDYVAGEEVWASYTGMDSVNNCNQKLFTIWGFTWSDPHSQCMIVSVRWQPPPVPTVQSERVAKTLDRFGLGVRPNGERELQLALRADSQTVNPKLLRMFRVTQGEPEVLERLWETNDWLEPVSILTEFRAVKSVRQYLNTLLHNSEKELEAVLPFVPDATSSSAALRNVRNVAIGQVAAVKHTAKKLEEYWIGLLDRVAA